MQAYSRVIYRPYESWMDRVLRLHVCNGYHPGRLPLNRQADSPTAQGALVVIRTEHYLVTVLEEEELLDDLVGELSPTVKSPTPDRLGINKNRDPQLPLNPTHQRSPHTDKSKQIEERPWRRGDISG